jgi:hypothetical protein
MPGSVAREGTSVPEGLPAAPAALANVIHVLGLKRDARADRIVAAGGLDQSGEQAVRETAALTTLGS